MSATIEYVDLTPSEGWVLLTVCRKESRKWDWVALLVDRSRVAREVWLRIPGKHRNVHLAKDALEAMTAKRH
jgi:hypothetical protein